MTVLFSLSWMGEVAIKWLGETKDVSKAVLLFRVFTGHPLHVRHRVADEIGRGHYPHGATILVVIIRQQPCKECQPGVRARREMKWSV